MARAIFTSMESRTSKPGQLSPLEVHALTRLSKLSNGCVADAILTIDQLTLILEFLDPNTKGLPSAVEALKSLQSELIAQVISE